MRFITVYRISILLLGFLLASCPAAQAELRQASEYDLKAVFILNFARFIDAPTDDNSEYLICYAGGEEVKASLAALRGKKVGNRTVGIKYCTSEEEAHTAHLIFIAQTEQHRTKELLAAVHGKPILTIAEYPDFREQGGMIQLLIYQERIIFNVNLHAVRESGVRVHPQLLKLANEVKE